MLFEGNRLEGDRLIKATEASNVLSNIGISIMENKSDFRPFNEVMTDLGRKLKHLRESMPLEDFEIIRTQVLRSICGIKFENQFKS